MDRSPVRLIVALCAVAAGGIGAAVFFGGWWPPSREPAPPAPTVAEKKPEVQARSDPASAAGVTASPPAIALPPTPSPAGPEPAPESTGSLPEPVLSPAALNFSAARSGGEIEVSGRMPEPVRDAILSEVRSLVPDAALFDHAETGGRGTLNAESRAAVKFAMAQLVDLNAGTIELREGRLSLKGEARDKQALATVTAALQQPPPGLKAQSPALAAAAIRPFSFSARREAGALVLRGHLPSGESRNEIIEAIRERFFHERVIDETRLADGAPPKFVTGVRFALDQLAQLASGEAILTGGTLRVAGETLYPEAAERMRQTIVKAPPPGFKGTAEIRNRESE